MLLELEGAHGRASGRVSALQLLTDKLLPAHSRRDE